MLARTTKVSVVRAGTSDQFKADENGLNVAKNKHRISQVPYVRGNCSEFSSLNKKKKPHFFSLSPLHTTFSSVHPDFLALFNHAGEFYSQGKKNLDGAIHLAKRLALVKSKQGRARGDDSFKTYCWQSKRSKTAKYVRVNWPLL